MCSQLRPGGPFLHAYTCLRAKIQTEDLLRLVDMCVMTGYTCLVVTYDDIVGRVRNLKLIKENGGLAEFERIYGR